MKQKAQIMDATALSRAMARITHEIIERNQGATNICLLGVKRRGVPLAAMLAENIKRFEGVEVPRGYLDITLHRDDMTDQEKQHAAEAAERRSQVGSGDRSERIRTYNFPQGRVTDHRINLTMYSLDRFMEGEIESMVEALASAAQAEALKAELGA